MYDLRYRSMEMKTFEIKEGSQGSVLTGIAIPYGVLSKTFREDGRDIQERIRSGAFDKNLNSGDNIEALVEHDRNRLLGSTASGTLRLRSTPEGISYEIDLADELSYVKDLKILNKRSELKFCSFGYLPVKEELVRRRNEVPLLDVIEGNLKEITICRRPRYPVGTSALLRSVDAAIARERIESSRRFFSFFTLRHPPRS